MNGLTKDQAKILYAALVNYSTNELRVLLREQGDHELADSITPFEIVTLALTVIEGAE